MKLLGFYNKDLAKQQIAYSDSNESREFEGIIIIKSANDYLMELQQCRESDREGKIMLIDKYVAAQVLI